jgi:hypothetical protein
MPWWNYERPSESAHHRITAWVSLLLGASFGIEWIITSSNHWLAMLAVIGIAHAFYHFRRSSELS